jgi:hypothetical protein
MEEREFHYQDVFSKKLKGKLQNEKLMICEKLKTIHQKKTLEQ